MRREAYPPAVVPDVRAYPRLRAAGRRVKRDPLLWLALAWLAERILL